jgi:hypothetical protein
MPITGETYENRFRVCGAVFGRRFPACAFLGFFSKRACDAFAARPEHRLLRL